MRIYSSRSSSRIGDNSTLSPTVCKLPLRQRPPRAAAVASQSLRKVNQRVTGHTLRASSATRCRSEPPQLTVRCTSALSYHSENSPSRTGRPSTNVAERSSLHRARFKDAPYLEVWCDVAPVSLTGSMHVWPRAKKAWDTRVTETPVFLIDPTEEVAKDDDSDYAGPAITANDFPAQPSSETIVPIEDVAMDDLEVKLSVPSRPHAPTPTCRVKSARPVLMGPQSPGPSPRARPVSAAILTSRGRPGSAASSASSESMEAAEVGYPLLDYDTQLQRHGWRMEVPGDPLGLK